MKALSWLVVGNDRQLAATSYTGRESATEKAHRKHQAALKAAEDERRTKARARRARDVRQIACAGQAWEDFDRYRERYRR